MKSFTFTLIFLLFAFFIKAEELATYKELSSLTNPAKLATLKKGNRSGNARFKKLLYWMNQYEKNGTTPKDFLSSLYDQHGKIAPYANENHVYAPKTEKLNKIERRNIG